jgi:uncharacterized phage protein (TIGR02218 family)
MRAASAGLIIHIASGSRTMAKLWKVTRTDGAIYGFTNHDADLVVDGLTYVADLGINASAVQTSVGLSVDNLDVTGFLASGTLTEEEVGKGLWDHAEVRLMECNWADLTMGVLKEKRGWIGEITTTDAGYKAEFRGLATVLNAPIGRLMAPGCPHKLGDAQCQVDLTDYTAAGVVTAAETDRRVFDTDLSAATVRLTPLTTGAPDLGYFDDGILTWTSGSANAGLEMDVKRYTVDGRIELHLPMGVDIVPGDEFSIVAGCNKALGEADTAGHCVNRFDNAVNHGGDPFAPGLDASTMAPGQASLAE